MANDSDTRFFVNRPASNIHYFTPAQSPPSGTAKPVSGNVQLPNLFTPLRIRGVEFQNRIFVSAGPEVFEVVYSGLNRFCCRFRQCVNTPVKMDTSRIGTWHTWEGSCHVDQD